MSEHTALWLIGMAFSGVGAFVSGVIWAVRIEGRLTAQEHQLSQLREDMRDDLQYIRDRLDQVLGLKRP